MQPLEQLVEQAKAWDTPWKTREGEAERQLQICNACRYCEGFCAVFPAMTHRLAFPAADIHYLANLCHNCGACLHACQYAPPHDFAVNLPRALARVRLSTYSEFAWPPRLAQLYARQGLTLALAMSGGLALMLALALLLHGTWWGAAPGGFYGVLPHKALVAVFAPVFLFAVLALAVGVIRFWRGVNAGDEIPGSLAAGSEALRHVLTLRYLDGGHGQGCTNDSDAWTLWRRRFHHVTFYGFLLCFAATVLATVYHYVFGWAAPYPLAFSWSSAPKLLGGVGGIGLLVGPAGLWVLNRSRDPAHGDPAQKTMDLGFIALLFLTAASGLALALWRSSPALPLLLCLHLGAVMALFATLPYGKFAHGVYRAAALLKWSLERRQPTRLRMGPE